MKSIDLLTTVEKVLHNQEITEEEYNKSANIVHSILFNYGVKTLSKEDVFNQLLMKLKEKSSTYCWNLSIYQRWNYVLSYLLKAMQEVVQVSHNIVDIPLYIIERGAGYESDIYEYLPDRFPADDFHEEVEKDLLLNHVKEVSTPKENYILQRAYIDGVQKKVIAKELKIKPSGINYWLDKIKKKALSGLGNQY